MEDILKDLGVGWLAFMGLVTLVGVMQATRDFVDEQWPSRGAVVFITAVWALIVVMLWLGGGWLRGWF